MQLVCFVPPEDLSRFSEEYSGEAVQFCTDIEEISIEEQRHSIFVFAHSDSRAIARLVHILRQDAHEPSRMVTEKADAASEAMHAALRAAGRGQRADEVMAAALRPYRRRTKNNLRRLSRKK